MWILGLFGNIFLGLGPRFFRDVFLSALHLCSLIWPGIPGPQRYGRGILDMFCNYDNMFFSLKCLYVECHLKFKLWSNLILKMNRVISHLSFLFAYLNSGFLSHHKAFALPAGFTDDPLTGSLSGLWTLQSYMEPRYGRWVVEQKSKRLSVRTSFQLNIQAYNICSCMFISIV